MQYILPCRTVFLDSGPFCPFPSHLTLSHSAQELSTLERKKNTTWSNFWHSNNPNIKQNFITHNRMVQLNNQKNYLGIMGQYLTCKPLNSQFVFNQIDKPITVQLYSCYFNITYLVYLQQSQNSLLLSSPKLQGGKPKVRNDLGG